MQHGVWEQVEDGMRFLQWEVNAEIEENRVDTPLRSPPAFSLPATHVPMPKFFHCHPQDDAWRQQDDAWQQQDDAWQQQDDSRVLEEWTISSYWTDVLEECVLKVDWTRVLKECMTAWWTWKYQEWQHPPPGYLSTEEQVMAASRELSVYRTMDRPWLYREAAWGGTTMPRA